MKRCVAALGIALVAGSALADVTYTYTGQALTVDPSRASGNLAEETAPLAIVLDFSSDGSTLLDWSISQPAMGTISPANVYTIRTGNIGDSPAIYLYTDASGAVRNWYVGAEVLDPRAPPGSLRFSETAVSWCGVVLGAPPLPIGLYAEEDANAGYDGNQCGTWSATGGVLRSFSYGDQGDLTTLARPVPEPSPIWLSLAGVAALSALRRRRGHGPSARCAAGRRRRARPMLAGS